MNKILIASTAVLVAACSFRGFQPPPDASAMWRLTNYNQLYPATVAKTMHLYSEEDYYWQANEALKKRYRDFRDCGYDPIGGGDSEQDKCLRKKGWYPLPERDPYPENRVYEWPRDENN